MKHLLIAILGLISIAQAQPFATINAGYSPRFAATLTAHINAGYRFTDADDFGMIAFATVGHELGAGHHLALQAGHSFINQVVYLGYSKFIQTASTDKLYSKKYYPVAGITFKASELAGFDIRYMGNGLHFTFQYLIK